MPTKRNRVSHAKAPQVSPTVLSILSEGLFAPPEGENDHERIEWKYFTDVDAKQRILDSCKDFILDEWTRQRPGTRPSWWWLSAPEVRRRLSGIGDVASDFLAYAPELEYGIPVFFLDPWLCDYYRGKAKDVNGDPIGSEYREGDFKGQSINQKDPPKFESQAAFLQRHNLLTPEEKRRLRKKDYEPEIISADDDD
jgi:hypothetical protein